MTSTAEMSVIETERLTLRKVTINDAPFMLRLLNEPSFIENIGDKKVRTLDDARTYIINGPLASYEKFGFGLLVVEIKNADVPIGICGLLKRDTLEHIDIGYALLPEFWSKGYAVEAAAAVLEYATTSLGSPKVLAITNPENDASIRVLEKLGFEYQRTIKFGEEAKDTKLFLRDAETT
jgi:[ribosomal protein S5]-alanine N-acetyltransferase